MSPTIRAVLLASTLGSRTTRFDLFQSANAELAGTLIFLVYLVWLRRYNVLRAKMSQEATTSAADYTVEVAGLASLPSLGDPAKRAAGTSTDALLDLSLIHI